MENKYKKIIILLGLEGFLFIISLFNYYVTLLGKIFSLEFIYVATSLFSHLWLSYKLLKLEKSNIDKGEL